MKQTKRFLVLTLLMSMLGLNAFAAFDTSTKILVDNLYYYLDESNHHAQVTSKPNDEKYVGSVIIPASIEHNSTEYAVTSIGEMAFSNCDGLTNVEIPTSVTSLEYGAFGGCGLESLTLPNGLTSIGPYAITSCPSLASINIPNTVTSIGEGAFDYCLSLESVSLPNVTSIADNTFRYCSNLHEVHIPNSITSIGNCAFQYCSSLNQIVPYGSSDSRFYNLTSIGNSAFEGCALYDINFLDGVTSIISIGERAFADCSALESIIIPTSVTSISDGVFDGCSHLASATIPTNVTSIGERAFASSGLTSITIPTSVTSIGAGVFAGCNSLTNIQVQNSNTTYDSRNSCKAIIETSTNTLIAGCRYTDIPNSVTHIGAKAFFGLSNLTYYGITYGVTSIGDQAFAWCRNLTSITIPASVTSIGNGAFQGCSGLTMVDIPNSITTIGSSAFEDCSSLTTVSVLNTSPVAITSNVFSNRANATLRVPKGSKVAYEAANYWKDFKNIVELPGSYPISFVDNNVKTVCVSHWDTNHDGEISLSEAEAVTTLSDEFKNNADITSFNELVYFTSLASIGDQAFLSCSALTSITIPNSVTSIGEGVFAGCSSLTSITIPNSVTSIGAGSFAECTGLTNIQVQNGNTYYDSRNDCKAIINSATNGLIAGCRNTIIPNSVTSIGERAFAGCSGLTSITIPNGVTDICSQAFSGCSGLTFITIPSSVTSIGDGAFDNCSNLTLVTVFNPTPVTITSTVFSNRANATLRVPTGSKVAYEAANYWKEFYQIVPTIITFADANVKSICVSHWDTNHDGEISITEAAAVTTLPDDFFMDNTSITSFDELAYFTGLTSIGVRTFCGCSNLTSITIPNGVTSIGENAFYGCSGLTSITIPDGVTTICSGAFAECSSLTSVTIPNTVTQIASLTFYGCSGLTSITIPNSVTIISVGAFGSCSSLTSIIIPNSVTSIGDYAFRYCSSLTSIEVESGNTNYDSRDNCNAIIETSSNTLIAGCKNTIIPNTVTTIGQHAFWGCSSLTSITIPNSVTIIGYEAFETCSGLTSIAIPASVTSIGGRTFAGCSSLKWVRLMRSESVTEIPNTNVFDECSSLNLIIVPENAGYETADKWSSFAAMMRTDKVTLFEENAPNTLMSWCDQFEYTKPAGCTVYGISGVTGNQVNLTAIDGDVIPAYSPVIIQRTEGSLDAPIKAEIYDIADGDDLVSSTAEGATLYGNTTEATITTGDFYAAGKSYVLYPGNKFLRVDTNEGIPAHRCMLTLSSPAATRSLSIGLGGDTTGMYEPKNERTEEQEANNTWYDLQGRPIGGKPSVKGIYIYKGKKLVVK